MTLQSLHEVGNSIIYMIIKFDAVQAVLDMNRNIQEKIGEQIIDISN